VDECKTLNPGSPFPAQVKMLLKTAAERVGQGLTLVHFPAQPKPFWSPTRVPLSNRLGETHVTNVSHKLCLR